MAIEKIYHLNECEVHVIFEQKLIRVEKPTELNKYLSRNLKKRSQILAQLIKADYLFYFNRPLLINDRSIIIEIWGHVFASYLAKIIKKIDFKMTKQFANFIISRSDRIDCGELDIDTNRFVWDMLAPLNRIFLFFVPKKYKLP